jgi:hypothetical protein
VYVVPVKNGRATLESPHHNIHNAQHTAAHARSGKQEERTLVFPQGKYTESPTLPRGGFLPAIGCECL